jgi:hypothetical protein
MQTKFKIIETDAYILAVSDEEIKENDHALDLTEDIDLKYDVFIVDKATLKFANQESKKIIAYQPKGNAPELDLPLLPEIVLEDNVEKLACKLYGVEYPEYMGFIDTQSLNRSLNEEDYGKEKTDAFYSVLSFVDGYNSSAKFYSENDLRKAFDFGFNEGINYADLKNIDEEAEEISDEYWDVFVKNLKPSKTPEWFVAEIEEVCRLMSADIVEKEGWVKVENAKHTYQRLKTTTINNKTFLVGKYVNE